MILISQNGLQKRTRAKVGLLSGQKHLHLLAFYSITSFVIKNNSCIGGKVKGRNYVGGIIGLTYSSNRPSQITNYIEGNYSSSSVIGNMCCGGIAGGVQAFYSEYHGYDYVNRYNIAPQIRDNHFGGK